MARHWTDKTDLEADILYRTFSESKIRHYQDICGQQMAMAYREHFENGRNMDDAMADLKSMENALTREMLRRLDARNSKKKENEK